MTWAKFDDGYYDNPKCSAAGKDGRALDTAGIIHCAKTLNDGVVPDHDLPVIAAKAGVSLKRTLAKLVDVGRWHEPGEFCGHTDTCRPCPPGHHVVHDYLAYNPTAEAEVAKRQARAEAGRKGGRKSRPPRPEGEANASANASATGRANTKQKPNPVPVPTEDLTEGDYSRPAVEPPGGNSEANGEANASPQDPDVDAPDDTEALLTAAATLLAQAETDRRHALGELDRPDRYRQSRIPPLRQRHEPAWRTMLDGTPHLTAQQLADAVTKPQNGAPQHANGAPHDQVLRTTDDGHMWTPGTGVMKGPPDLPDPADADQDKIAAIQQGIRDRLSQPNRPPDDAA